MTPIARRVLCRLGCGKSIIWGETADGKKIPLDPVAPVYYASTPETAVLKTKQSTGTVVCQRAHTIPQAAPEKDYPDAMVSHFATCSQVGKLKAKGITTHDAAVKELEEPGA